MNGRWSHRFDGHLRLMGVDVPLRNGPQRIAFAIIIAGLITVPLIPFIESPTSIWGRWVGAGFVRRLSRLTYSWVVSFGGLPGLLLNQPGQFGLASSVEPRGQIPGSESSPFRMCSAWV